MSDFASVLKLMKDEDVEYLDLRFVDPRGRLQHVTVIADIVDEDLDRSLPLDKSSIARRLRYAKNDSDINHDLD